MIYYVLFLTSISLFLFVNTDNYNNNKQDHVSFGLFVLTTIYYLTEIKQFYPKIEITHPIAIIVVSG